MKSPSRRPRLVIACLALAAAACGGLVIEDRWPVYRVVGRVTGPSGLALAGVTVSARSLWGAACAETLSLGGPFTTGRDGRYAGGFGSAAGTFDGCVEVTAVAPPGAGLLTTTRRLTDVHLRAERGDSVVVDVQLAAAP
jgi:hypothetical protein